MSARHLQQCMPGHGCHNISICMGFLSSITQKSGCQARSPLATAVAAAPRRSQACALLQLPQVATTTATRQLLKHYPPKKPQLRVSSQMQQQQQHDRSAALAAAHACFRFRCCCCCWRPQPPPNPTRLQALHLQQMHRPLSNQSPGAAAVAAAAHTPAVLLQLPA